MTTTEGRHTRAAPAAAVRNNVVYVGIDGPPPAAAHAAVWAAQDARRRGAALCLVHVDTFVPTGYGGEIAWPPLTPAAHSAWQQALPADLVRSVRAAFPDVDVRSVVGTGTPTEALHDVARHGLMAVVGSHSRHQLVDVLLGSIAAGAVGHGLRSVVVVVREDPRTGAVRGTGPIVVALDGSPESDAALAFALEEADLRSRVVFAVRCWDDAVVDDVRVRRVASDRSDIDDEEGRLLSDQLAGWRDRYPDVVMTARVVRGQPVTALLRLCSTPGRMQPELLVVGSRGLGGLAGLLLGSTSQAVIARAPCPVAVVRGRRATQPR